MLEERWRVQETADYLCSRTFSVVTLQFPDEYLQHASRVFKAVQAACDSRGHYIQVRPCGAAPVAALAPCLAHTLRPAVIHSVW